MKRFIFTTLITLSFLSNYGFAGTIEKTEPCTLRINLCFQIVGRIGIESEDCHGVGLSCLRVIKCRLVQDNNLQPSEPESVRLLISNISDTQYSVTFLTNQAGDLNIDRDIEMPAEVAKGFNKRSITFLKGKYTVTRNRDGSVTAVVNAR